MSSILPSSYSATDGSYAMLPKATWHRISMSRSPLATNSGPWSVREHLRFVDGVRLFPNGPWRLVADYVGTRTVRQVQTHHQKIVEKTRRHRRGLLKKRKTIECDSISSPTPSTSSSSSDDLEWSSLMLDPIDFSMPSDAVLSSPNYEQSKPQAVPGFPECSADDLSSLLDLLSDDYTVII